MNDWISLLPAIVLAVVVGGLGLVWPQISARYTAKRFHRIIAREFAEIGPYPEHPSGVPWWAHLQKRFIHEEILGRERLSENREFILSMDATVLYQVTQLWTSFDKRDGGQWLHYLEELSRNKLVGGDALRNAHAKWIAIVNVGAQDESSGLRLRREDLASSRSVTRVAGLFDHRAAAYKELLPLTRFDPAFAEESTRIQARKRRAEDLTEWLYSSGGGIVMSGSMLATFLTVRNSLEAQSIPADELKRDFSSLRTSMKIDLGVRHPDERDVPMAAPVDETGW
jgi:hypothetical protein